MRSRRPSLNTKALVRGTCDARAWLRGRTIPLGSAARFVQLAASTLVRAEHRVQQRLRRKRLLARGRCVPLKLEGSESPLCRDAPGCRHRGGLNGLGSLPQSQTSTHLASGASHPLCTPEVRRWIEPLDMAPIATMTYCRWYGDPADRVRDAQSASMLVILGAQRFQGGGEPMSRSLVRRDGGEDHSTALR